jgi:iron complex transport system substrate-binding protein
VQAEREEGDPPLQVRPSLIAAGVLATILMGCGGAVPRAPVGPPARVVTLAPSVTEVLFALGAGTRLVGACAQCDWPEAAGRVPRVGGYLTPSVEAVLALRPDLVLAVPSPGNREVVRTVERAGVRVEVVQDRTLADLWASIRTIARALGVPEAGEALVGDVQARLDAVHARVAGRPPRRTLVVVGHSPLVVVGGGTLQDELVTLAGGVNVAADAGQVWPTITLEVVVARAPEVILDAAMGTEAGARALFAGLTTVPAVRDDRIVVLPDDAIFRAGPRVVEAAAELARTLHPDAFAAGEE